MVTFVELYVINSRWSGRSELVISIFTSTETARLYCTAEEALHEFGECKVISFNDNFVDLEESKHE